MRAVAVVLVAPRTGLLDVRVVGVEVKGCRRVRSWEGVERRVGVWVWVWMSMPEIERRLSCEVERWGLCGWWVGRGE